MTFQPCPPNVPAVFGLRNPHSSASPTGGDTSSTDALTYQRKRAEKAERRLQEYVKECRRIHANGQNWCRQYAYKVIGDLLEREKP